MKTKSLLALCYLVLHSSFVLSARSQGTDFTYQGRLNDGASSANGIYDVRFTIYDSSAGGSQQGPILTNFATAVSNGLVTATLDFGAGIFNGQNRWLEIAVRTNGNGGFTTLSPRRRVTPVPYAIAAGSLLAPLTGSLLQGTYPGILSLNNGANSFSGNGAGLTGLSAGSLTGTVADARLTANVALRAGGNAFTGNQTVAGGALGIGTVALDRPLVVQADGGSELMSLKDNTGANRWHLNLQNGGLNFAESSVADGRLFLGTNGNVGLGTLAPDATLDVAGTIRTRSGGIVFPDGSTQFRATDSLPLTTSGLPNGSTFTVTIGGTAATLTGQYRLTHPAPASGISGSYLYSGGISLGGKIKVRRTHTSDLTWQEWIPSFSLRPLTMLLMVPGGATVTWSGDVWPVALNLVQSGGTLYDELECNLQVILSRMVSGAPSVSAPTGDLPGISLSINASTIPNISFYSPFDSTGLMLDHTTGDPIGPVLGPFVRIRTNPFSNQGPYSRFAAAATGDTTVITVGGGTLITSPDTLYTEYVLRLADDGLPIEEFSLAMNLPRNPPSTPSPEPPTGPGKETR